MLVHELPVLQASSLTKRHGVHLRCGATLHNLPSCLTRRYAAFQAGGFCISTVPLTLMYHVVMERVSGKRGIECKTLKLDPQTIKGMLPNILLVSSSLTRLTSDIVTSGSPTYLCGKCLHSSVSCESEYSKPIVIES